MQESIRKHPYLHKLAGILAVAMMAASASAAEAPSPSSAVFDEWQRICVPRDGAHQCTVSQLQIERESNQRLLIVELQHAEGGGLQGGLVLPLGVLLPNGVRMSLDQKGDFGVRRAFSTCLPDGCVVPLQFDAAEVQQLRAAGTLNIHVVAAGDHQPMQFRIPLKGLTAALASLPR